jgi:hypothetical protein
MGWSSHSRLLKLDSRSISYYKIDKKMEDALKKGEPGLSKYLKTTATPKFSLPLEAIMEVGVIGDDDDSKKKKKEKKDVEAFKIDFDKSFLEKKGP